MKPAKPRSARRELDQQVAAKFRAFFGFRGKAFSKRRDKNMKNNSPPFICCSDPPALAWHKAASFEALKSDETRAES